MLVVLCFIVLWALEGKGRSRTFPQWRKKALPGIDCFLQQTKLREGWVPAVGPTPRGCKALYCGNSSFLEVNLHARHEQHLASQVVPVVLVKVFDE